MARYRVTLDEAPEEEYEVELDDNETPDFGKLEDEVRKQRAASRAQDTAKKALDKAVQPVRTLKDPLIPYEEKGKDTSLADAAKGLASKMIGPALGFAVGGLVGGPIGAGIGGLGGMGAESPAELALTAVPSPKLPVKLPGALGKLLGPSARQAVPEEVSRLIPSATPYASAAKARIANMLKGGAEGAAEGMARGSVLRAMQGEDAGVSGKDALMGGALGAVAGAANVSPIKKTLKEQADARLGVLDKEAQALREDKLGAIRKIEKQREEATKLLRPNTTKIKGEIPAQEAALKALEDTISQRQGAVKSDRTALLTKEQELARIVAERAAQGKTRPTKAITTLQQEIGDLKTKLSGVDAAETADIANLKSSRDTLAKNRSTLDEFTKNPQDFDARVKMMVDDYLQTTPSKAGAKKTKAEVESELLDRINKGELDMEKLAGQVRDIAGLYKGKKREDIMGSITSELAYHAYQGVKTGPIRAALGGLGAAIAHSDPEKKAQINKWLSQKMSSEALQNINKMMEGTINKLNEKNDEYEVRELLKEEEKPKERNALLDAIAAKEGLYTEGDDVNRNIPKRLNNPGGLRNTEGKFIAYPDVEEGFKGLEDRLRQNSKMKLRDYVAKHAPAGDGGNDPVAYYNFLREELKKKKGIDVTDDTLVSELLDLQ